MKAYFCNNLIDFYNRFSYIILSIFYCLKNIVMIDKIMNDFLVHNYKGKYLSKVMYLLGIFISGWVDVTT